LWGATQLRQGVFGRLRIVSNWSIDPLGLERAVTNVIPLKPNGEELNPTRMIDRLHALCEKLQQVKSEALHLEQQLRRGPQATKQGLVARSATSETIVLVSKAVDVVVEAVAELIVETTAELIAPHSPAKN
jgi:hypothetical protein